MQVTLKGIVNENKVGKNTGKSFISCRLQVFSNNLQKDVWLSGFGDAMTKTWSAGDVIDIDIITGKLNARPQENAEIVKEIAKEFNGEVSDFGNPVGEIKVEDIPF